MTFDDHEIGGDEEWSEEGSIIRADLLRTPYSYENYVVLRREEEGRKIIKKEYDL